jgi:hypothetical protein
MSSRIDVYNLALAKLAVSVYLPATTDQSKEARVLNRLWDHSRDQSLAARNWPWAMKEQALAVMAEAAQPGWTYRYAVPNDLITGVSISDQAFLAQTPALESFSDLDWLDSHTGYWSNWKLARAASSASILTNRAEAWLVYVARVEEPEEWPPMFVEVVACRLALNAAPAIIGDVGINAKRALADEHSVALTEAGAQAFSQAQNYQSFTSAAERSRG